MMSNSQCINVMFICNEWGSSKGGLSTFNREFAVNLAKESSDKIKVHCYVCSSSEEDRGDAKRQEVNLITARRVPGASDPMDWLKKPPSDLPYPHAVVGHGRKFGIAAHFISEITKCKWIHFVHVFCEDLGKHKLEGSATADAIAENEEKHRQELELCEAADLVVAVGSQLQRKYNRILPDIKIEAITPGIFEKLVIPANQSVKFQPAEAEEFRIFMFGRGSFEDFALKGYDIIGKAVALIERKFELTFVGSPRDEQRKIEKWFIEETKIARNQLTIRSYRNYEEMKKMLREADLIVMPSRTEGFGLVALEAISAGVPVLVSSESGIAESLKNVEGGMSVVVNSEKPEEWARKIRGMSELKPEKRHARAIYLREQYEKTYSWKNECERFEQMIHELVQRPRKAAPLNFPSTGQDGAKVSQTSSTASGAEWKNKEESSKGQDGATISQTSSTASGSEWKNKEESSKDQKRNTASPTSNETTGFQKQEQRSRWKDSLFGIFNKSRSKKNEEGKSSASTDSKKNTGASSNDGRQSAAGGKLVDKESNECHSLHYAARDGDVNKIESLLSIGVPIDCRDDNGMTALMYAALNDKLQAVQCLLKKGADPSLQNNDGFNLLHYASQGDNPVIIELMLSQVPSIDSRNNGGVTALMNAAGLDKLQAVQCLLEKGADPSLQANNGYNSLHCASHCGNSTIIEKMLSYGVDIESRTKRGSTPLMIAQRYGKTEAVTYLLSKGAKLSKQ